MVILHFCTKSIFAGLGEQGEDMLECMEAACTMQRWAWRTHLEDVETA